MEIESNEKMEFMDFIIALPEGLHEQCRTDPEVKEAMEHILNMSVVLWILKYEGPVDALTNIVKEVEELQKSKIN